jgi:conjugal transfer/type IV secretion protein DotA/TraY
MFLPGIIPRLRAFGRKGFSDLAYLMATIYSAVRLLPPNHPYLLPANKGRFGLRHVIGEAYSRLVFKKENIDQIIVFFALLLGFVLLVMQFVLTFAWLVMRPAFGATLPVFAGIFATPDPVGGGPSTDIALMLLDYVFGIPNVFTTYPSNAGTCVAQVVSCGPTSPTPVAFPSPFHVGLHRLFQYYDLAILLISCLIFLYYILVIVAETAMTGTPFGKRFDHIWAPIRLVVALGLLVPVNFGMNSAQFIALYAAKLGSGFATNGWFLYQTSLIASMGGAANWHLLGSPVTTLPATNAYDPQGNLIAMAPAAATNKNTLIARPKTPDIASVIEFMSLVVACKVAYETKFPPAGNNTQIQIEPYLVKQNLRQQITAPNTPNWNAALTFYDNKDIIIRFGHYRNVNPYPNTTGGVSPYCGEIKISTKDVSGAAGPTGSAILQAGFYNWVTSMFFNPVYRDFGTRAACIHITPSPLPATCNAINFGAGDDPGYLPPDAWKQARNVTEWSTVNVFVDQAYKSILATTTMTVSPAIRARGWGGAGIWYNQIAEWNGSLFGIVADIPTPSAMPTVMQKVEESRKSDETVLAYERYEVNVAQAKLGGSNISFENPGEEMIARDLSDVFMYWEKSKSTTLVEGQAQGNVITAAMNYIFGTDGLYNIRQNDSVNPLAQLVAIGKSIMDAAFRNLLYTFAFSAGGGMLTAMDKPIAGGVGSALAIWFSTFASIGLTIGFTLYYVLPFMPFIYFYFAVGAWIKTIFEAMVGVPLWAMAHLKIDGNGLPADSALNGYFLIFEIFVRPILTIFGLLASIAIFSALVRTMNGIFGLVAENVTGFDCSGCSGLGPTNVLFNKRNIMDEFFFTVMYTVLVYLMGTSCFKLIDQVPEGIMRWMGSGAQSFAEGVAPPGEELMEYATLGANQAGGAVTSATSSLGGATGTFIGRMINSVPEVPQAGNVKGGVKP